MHLALHRRAVANPHHAQVNKVTARHALYLVLYQALRTHMHNRHPSA